MTYVNSHVSSSDFFVNLRKKAKIIADTIAKDTADDMLFILRLRGNLPGSGNGRYPKFKDGKSKFSHRHWAITTQGNNEYWLSNDMTGGTFPEYNYPKQLLFGNPDGWNAKAQKAAREGTAKNLVMDGSKIFSKQMPHGIEPAMKIKREQMKDEIRAKFREHTGGWR